MYSFVTPSLSVVLEGLERFALIKCAALGRVGQHLSGSVGCQVKVGGSKWHDLLSLGACGLPCKSGWFLIPPGFAHVASFWPCFM